MQVLYPCAGERSQPAVLTLGMFDGVHLGHRALLRRARAVADSFGARAAVYTMRNHPARAWGDTPPGLLMTAAEKCAALRALGMDDVYAVCFSREMAQLSPASFVELLTRALDIRAMVVGYNYSFGSGGEGSAQTLRALGKTRGFGVEVVDAVEADGEKVSSQRIRSLLLEGDAKGATRLLGAPYMLSGTVCSCRGLGSKLGFPTANLGPDDGQGMGQGKLLPQNGVYAARAYVMGREYAAMTNIGERPTVDGSGNITVETHIFDFSYNCVGERLRVAFHQKMRDERHFGSLQALQTQLREDKAQIKAYFDC